MALATRPFSRELSTLTSSIKQLHSTNREQARRIRPMDKSDKVHFTKRCLPGQGDATCGRVIDKKNGEEQNFCVVYFALHVNLTELKLKKILMLQSEIGICQYKMAYIAVHVQKSCVSPTTSDCPVGKETDRWCHVTVRICQGYFYEHRSFFFFFFFWLVHIIEGCGTLTAVLWHQRFTRLLFLTLWSPVAMAAMTDRSSCTKRTLLWSHCAWLWLKCSLMLPSGEYREEAP